MPSTLLSRSLGFVEPHVFQTKLSAQRVRSLHAAPYIQFDGIGESGSARSASDEGANAPAPIGHPAGVNSITIDKFDGRYLLSGGADATIRLWDLEAVSSPPLAEVKYRPHGIVSKSTKAHLFGITSLSFYPFDPYAFISSSYDHTLRVWDTLTLKSAASFTLPAPIYAHGISATATHLLVAAATKHPHVRLLDLRSGSATHSLAGHDGAVLSVAWSPTREHVLASAGADGCVRVWDIRRSGSVLGLLDYEDSVGITADFGSKAGGTSVTNRQSAKAHVGPCNGLKFTDDGAYIVTSGHDERIRVWNASTGANTLVHFGPTVRNRVLATVQPLIVPSLATGTKQQVLLYPSGPEIMMLDLHEGKLLQRLRAVSGLTARVKGEKGLQQRVADLAWRAGHLEVYSAHTTGMIKAWASWTSEDAADEIEDARNTKGSIQAEEEQGEEGDRKRKREELNEMFRQMTKQKITFT